MLSDLRLTVLKSYTPLRASLSGLKHLLLALGLMAVIAGVAPIYMISDRVTRPLASLVEGVRAVERGDFAYPLGSSGGEGLGQVTPAFFPKSSTFEKNEATRPKHRE